MSKTETKVGWTPGPWIYVNGAIRAVKDGIMFMLAVPETPIFGAAETNVHAASTNVKHEREANARLISKAPEMADLLDVALAAIRSPESFETEIVAQRIERLLSEIAGER